MGLEAEQLGLNLRFGKGTQTNTNEGICVVEFTP